MASDGVVTAPIATASTAGVLRPHEFARHVTLVRDPVGPSAGHWVENRWSLRWDLPGGRWYHSEVLRPRWRYRLIYEPFLNVPLRRAQRIVVSSPALLEHAAALRPHAYRCEVIPFGLDVAGPDAGSHPSVSAVRIASTTS